jgi:hypothetical protein
VFEMTRCKECNASLRRSCSLCSSQGARRDKSRLEAAGRERAGAELDGRTRVHCPGVPPAWGSLLQNRAVKTGFAGVRWCSSRPGRAEHDWRGHRGSDGTVSPNNQ